MVLRDEGDQRYDEQDTTNALTEENYDSSDGSSRTNALRTAVNTVMVRYVHGLRQCER